MNLAPALKVGVGYPAMPRFAAYVRVSSAIQKERATIQTQLSALKNYARANNIRIAHTFADDGVSGTVPVSKRIDGHRLLEEAKKGSFDTLLLFRIDRLSRDTLELLKTVKQLEEYGVAVRSITEPFETTSPVGKFTLTMVSSMAQMEKDAIKERSIEGMKRRAKEGYWVGGRAPFGYRILDSKLQPNEAEAVIVREVFSTYVEGASLQAIADTMNAKNVPTPAAQRFPSLSHIKWRASTVQKLLHNEIYKGIFRWGKRAQGKNGNGERTNRVTDESEQIVAEVEGIVSPKLFEKAQERLKLNLKFSQRNGRREYTLRGLVRCGVCGLLCSGTGGEHFPVYHCDSRRAKRECDRPRIKAPDLENAIWNDLVDLSSRPDSLIKTLRARRDDEQGADAVKTRLALIGDALGKKAQERAKVLNLLRRDVISEDEAENELRSIEREQTALERERDKLQDTARRIDEFEDSLMTITTALKRIKKGARTATPAERGEMFRTVIRQITLDRKNNVEIDFILPPLS